MIHAANPNLCYKVLVIVVITILCYWSGYVYDAYFNRLGVVYVFISQYKMEYYWL